MSWETNPTNVGLNFNQRQSSGYLPFLRFRRKKVLGGPSYWSCCVAKNIDWRPVADLIRTKMLLRKTHFFRQWSLVIFYSWSNVYHVRLFLAMWLGQASRSGELKQWSKRSDEYRCFALMAMLVTVMRSLAPSCHSTCLHRIAATVYHGKRQHKEQNQPKEIL